MLCSSALIYQWTLATWVFIHITEHLSHSFTPVFIVFPVLNKNMLLRQIKVQLHLFIFKLSSLPRLSARNSGLYWYSCCACSVSSYGLLCFVWYFNTSWSIFKRNKMQLSNGFTILMVLNYHLKSTHIKPKQCWRITKNGETNSII